MTAKKVDNTSLRRRICQFLEQRGGSASSVDIVAAVLRIRNARPSTAERLVQTLLADDPAFVPDGLGNWRLRPHRPVGERPLGKMPLTVVAARRGESPQGPVVEIAFVALDNGRVAAERVFGLIWRRGKWQVDDRMDVTETELCRWLERLQEGVWVAFRPAPVRSVLRPLFLQTLGSPIVSVELSLQHLGRRLLPSQRLPDVQHLARALAVDGATEDTTLASARLVAEVWLAVQEQLHALGRVTVEQVIAFQDQNRAGVDFSRFGFDLEFIQRLPEAPGVYIMRDRQDRVIYVGKASNLAQRVGSYFLRRAQPEAKIQRLLADLHRIEIRRAGNELDALLMESRLIRRYRPVINQQIDIQGEKDPAAEVGNVVFLLPANRKKQVVLFGLSRHRRFLRLAFHPPDTRLAQIQQAIERLLSEPKARHSAGSSAAWQIAARWFRRHRAVVSFVDLDTFASLREAASTVLRLAGDPQARHQRVVHLLKEIDA